MLREPQHDNSNTNWLIKQHICSDCHAEALEACIMKYTNRFLLLPE
jgi:hypothetical protein